jgi:hypothetical protein
MQAYKKEPHRSGVKSRPLRLKREVLAHQEGDHTAKESEVWQAFPLQQYHDFKT